jgi:hypothetical protein
MKNLFLFILSGIIIFNSGCSGTSEREVADSNDITTIQSEPEISREQTKSVLEHHLAAFGENDLVSIMADYSNESIVVTPDSTYVGLKQIEAFFVSVFPAFPVEGTTSEIDRIVIENELAYVVWHAETPTVEVPLGTDTFIIEDGKIKLQTFAGIINPI